MGDLLTYFPFRHEEERRPQSIDSLVLDETATVIGVIDRIRTRGGHGPSNINVRMSDGTSQIHLTFFNAPYLQDRLERGQVLRAYGKVGEYDSYAQMVNPKIEFLNPDEDPARWDYARWTPVYRGSGELESAQIARMVETAVKESLSFLGETLPPNLRERRGLAALQDAIKGMHVPKSAEELSLARRRVAYEELFLMQTAITLGRRFTATRTRAERLVNSVAIDERIRKRFPFPLTPAQNRVVAEIAADLERERPMTRLLQGDVGSGKTVVALYAALVCVANRRQCAILAPTEVLAAQHFAGIEKYLAGSRVNRCLLTGKTKQAERKTLLDAIARGEMDLIVGTQALLEQKVRFSDLALVVVDEQHKFGVAQRALLRGKSREEKKELRTANCKLRNEKQIHETKHGTENRKPETGNRTTRSNPQFAIRNSQSASLLPTPHYLVMTATPIPRTLSMTVFGDLDVSVIDRLPPGRQPIVTRLVRSQQEPAAWLEVRRRIAEGDQVYIVYPLVEESDSLDLKAATVEVEHVRRDLLPGSRVGLMHGRMPQAQKTAVMREFASGKLDVLVSTTVIEVGVDVPNATVMVVQHADRYGMSALHQLRGRVGRGSKPSICLLFSDSKSDLARQRLGTLCQTTDGFKIAEEDLKMRGPGELLGTRQHGWPEFCVANPVEDVELLMQARDDAAQLAQQDPFLRDSQHAALKSELRRRFRDKVAFIDVA